MVTADQTRREPSDNDLEQDRLRTLIAGKIGASVSSLESIKFAHVNKFIPSEGGELDHAGGTDVVLGVTQFLAGKYLEVVITIYGIWLPERAFEIAELGRINRLPQPIYQFRRSDGSISFEQSASLRETLSPDDLGAVAAKTIRQLSTRRRRRYRRCLYCKEMIEPGSLFRRDVCFACASEVFGILF